MLRYDSPVYRPPSEADSLILQATLGCSHNRCSFCYMYKGKSFTAKSWDELRSEIDEAARLMPDTRRVFLADGDAFVLSTPRLEQILDYLNSSFAGLQRVTAYANPSNLLVKSVPEMARLREKGLTVLYYGVESGDPTVLEKIDKGATCEEMAEGCAKAHEAGLKLSITVILGLAGRMGSARHAERTARLISTIGPRYLSALTLMLGPYEQEYGARMGEDFEFNTPADDLAELRTLVRMLDVERCIFRSNHASNYLPLKGTLKKDREKLLEVIDRAAEEPERYLRDEWMRGL